MATPRLARILHWLGIMCFACLIIFAAARGVVRPNYNSDMINYLGLVADQPGWTAKQRQAEALRVTRAVTSDEQWAELTTMNAYARLQSRDAAFFERSSGMYEVKAGYISIARWLAPAFGPFRALFLLTTIGTLLMGAVAIAWMLSGGFGQAGFLLVPLMVFDGVLEVPRAIHPDYLAAAPAIVGAYLISRNQSVGAAIALAAATWIRPDMIFVAAGFFVVAVAVRRSLRCAAMTLAACTAVYLFDTHGVAYPGWWYQDSLVLFGAQAAIDGIPRFTPQLFATGTVRSIGINLVSMAWPWLAGLITAAWLLASPPRPETSDGAGPRSSAPGATVTPANRNAEILFAGLLVSLAARLLLFPLPNERIYTPTLMMMALLTAERCRPRFDIPLRGYWRAARRHLPGRR